MINTYTMGQARIEVKGVRELVEKERDNIFEWIPKHLRIPSIKFFIDLSNEEIKASITINEYILVKSGKSLDDVLRDDKVIGLKFIQRSIVSLAALAEKGTSISIETKVVPYKPITIGTENYYI